MIYYQTTAVAYWRGQCWFGSEASRLEANDDGGLRGKTTTTMTSCYIFVSLGIASIDTHMCVYLRSVDLRFREVMEEVVVVRLFFFNRSKHKNIKLIENKITRISWSF